MRTEVLKGDTYGPFNTIESTQNFLDSIPSDSEN